MSRTGWIQKQILSNTSKSVVCIVVSFSQDLAMIPSCVQTDLMLGEKWLTEMGASAERFGVNVQ